VHRTESFAERPAGERFCRGSGDVRWIERDAWVGCSANSNDIAEVLLREGGQDDDVMGWGRDELLHDVLDQYERHIHFLNAVR